MSERVSVIARFRPKNATECHVEASLSALERQRQNAVVDFGTRAGRVSVQAGSQPGKPPVQHRFDFEHVLPPTACPLALPPRAARLAAMAHSA